LLNADLYRIPLKEAPEEKDSIISEELIVQNETIIQEDLRPEEVPGFEEEIIVPEKQELTEEITNDLLLFGTVYDATTDIPINADIIFSYTEYEADPINLKTLNNSYRLKITDSMSYHVTVIREGYLPYETTINITEFRQQKVKKIDFKIVPLFKGEKIILNNLYFDANRSSIKPESFEELDRLYYFLVTNPGMKIEIGGHTNGLCSESFCEKLSQNRANAVREYLINKGIDGMRITAVGYGSTDPIDTNSTPEGRRKNQRVEITFK